MNALMNRVKIPSENMLRGNVSMIRAGLRNAFKSPMMRAAVITTFELAALTPAMVCITTKRDPKG